MSTGAITNKRMAEIKALRPDWLEIIEKAYLDEGAVRMTVWPDEETIYFGSDEEFETLVKRYKLKEETTGKRDTLWNTY